VPVTQRPAPRRPPRPTAYDPSNYLIVNVASIVSLRVECTGPRGDLVETPMIPKILHGTRILHDLLLRGGLLRLLKLVRRALRRCAGFAQSGRQPGRGGAGWLRVSAVDRAS